MKCIWSLFSEKDIHFLILSPFDFLFFPGRLTSSAAEEVLLSGTLARQPKRPKSGRDR